MATSETGLEFQGEWVRETHTVFWVLNWTIPLPEPCDYSRQELLTSSHSTPGMRKSGLFNPIILYWNFDKSLLVYSTERECYRNIIRGLLYFDEKEVRSKRCRYYSGLWWRKPNAFIHYASKLVGVLERDCPSCDDEAYRWERSVYSIRWCQLKDKQRKEKKDQVRYDDHVWRKHH